MRRHHGCDAGVERGAERQDIVVPELAGACVDDWQSAVRDLPWPGRGREMFGAGEDAFGLADHQSRSDKAPPPRGPAERVPTMELPGSTSRSQTGARPGFRPSCLELARGDAGGAAHRVGIVERRECGLEWRRPMQPSNCCPAPRSASAAIRAESAERGWSSAASAATAAWVPPRMRKPPTPVSRASSIVSRRYSKPCVASHRRGERRGRGARGRRRLGQMGTARQARYRGSKRGSPRKGFFFFFFFPSMRGRRAPVAWGCCRGGRGDGASRGTRTRRLPWRRRRKRDR